MTKWADRQNKVFWRQQTDFWFAKTTEPNQEENMRRWSGFKEKGCTKQDSTDLCTRDKKPPEAAPQSSNTNMKLCASRRNLQSFMCMSETSVTLQLLGQRNSTWKNWAQQVSEPNQTINPSPPHESTSKKHKHWSLEIPPKVPLSGVSCLSGDKTCRWLARHRQLQARRFPVYRRTVCSKGNWEKCHTCWPGSGCTFPLLAPAFF